MVAFVKSAVDAVAEANEAAAVRPVIKPYESAADVSYALAEVIPNGLVA